MTFLVLGKPSCSGIISCGTRRECMADCSKVKPCTKCCKGPGGAAKM